MKAFLKCIFWYLKNNSTGRVKVKTQKRSLLPLKPSLSPALKPQAAYSAPANHHSIWLRSPP